MIKSGINKDKKEKYSNYLTAEFKLPELYVFYKEECIKNNQKIIEFRTYSEIVKEYNKEIIELILNGKKISLGSRIGTVKIVEKERPLFIKEDGTMIGIVDWISTTKLNEIDPSTGKLVKVYYDDPYLYNTLWMKNNCGIKNSRFYSFKKTKYFRKLMGVKIKGDKLITLQYRKNS